MLRVGSLRVAVEAVHGCRVGEHLQLGAVVMVMAAAATPAAVASHLWFVGAGTDIKSHLALQQWCELPPGHFISGRSPKVQQFALTPQQLSIRET